MSTPTTSTPTTSTPPTSTPMTNTPPTSTPTTNTPPTRTRLRDALRTKARSDRGSAILEFTGFLPILLIVAVAVIQLGLIGYAGSQAGTAARAAARAASLEPGTGQAAGLASISGWMQDGAQISAAGADLVEGKATIQVPSVFPGFNFFGPVTRTVTMPSDDPP